MKLVVGLGNPGKKYEKTRHNFGQLFVQELSLARRVASSTLFKNIQLVKVTLSNQELLLVGPLAFMNESGQSVTEVMHYYHIAASDLWVVHDDLDLPFGAVRLSFDASSGGHRGVESIITVLGSKEFHRLRLGIGRPPENIPAEDFVLQSFTLQEQKQLDATIALAIQKLTDSLEQ